MAKFCTKCGKALPDGEVCECSKQNILTQAWSAIRGINVINSENEGFLERNKKIVPESIRPEEGETTIKQYRFARLRSKIRGQYAEGRLQVTNKRLLFRATGFSTLGKTVFQQEFAIDEIGGIEIKKSNRISFLNVFFCIFLSGFVSSGVEGIFDSMLVKAEFLATFLSLILTAGCCALFIILKKNYWWKLITFSAGIGALIGTNGAPISPMDIIFGLKLFSFTNILIAVLSLGWFFVMIRVCFVPDLMFNIKTKSASDVAQIRRRVWGVFMKQPQEYTGFSEVLPWDDTDTVAEELGAMISDLQMLGDMAIDMWKKE